MARISIVAAGAVFLAALGCVAAPPASAASDEAVIVVLKPGVNASDKTDEVIDNLDVQPELQFRTALPGFSARVSPLDKQRLAADPDVLFVSPDKPVQSLEIVGSGAEPTFGSSDGGDEPVRDAAWWDDFWKKYQNPSPALSPADTVPSGISRISTERATVKSDIGVAVVDTGISTYTKDLNIGAGYNCVSKYWPTSDDNGHGTHVAGTIAAQQNNSKVVGVAPGTRVHPIKVLDSKGSGSWSRVICGLDWLTANGPALGIKVANLSLGGGGTSDKNCGRDNNDALHLAICRTVAAGINIVAAAGNNGGNLAGQVPAAYPEVLTVTAMSDTDGKAGAVGPVPSCRNGESDDMRATFSNYAVTDEDEKHTIAAPGVCVRSLASSLFGTTTVMSGTSMAAPHVAGALALCIAKGGVSGPCSGLSPAQVIAKLRADAQDRSAANGFTGDPSTPFAGRRYGYLVSADY